MNNPWIQPSMILIGAIGLNYGKIILRELIKDWFEARAARIAKEKLIEANRKARG